MLLVVGADGFMRRVDARLVMSSRRTDANHADDQRRARPIRNRLKNGIYGGNVRIERTRGFPSWAFNKRHVPWQRTALIFPSV
jgi:hypothetical protein